MRSVADRLLLAIEHHRAWRYAMAEALYAEVLAAEPRHAQTSYLYGLLLLDTGRSREAVVKLRDAAVIWPRHPGILAHLARALLADEQPEPALATIDRLAAVAPDNAQTAFLRGTVLNALGEPSRSIAAFEQAIARDPMNAAAFLNLGNAHAELDRLDAAEGYCRQALAVDPRLAEAHASLGFILTSLGRLDEAIAACEAAIALRPDFAQAQWNQAVAALLAGNFPLGFHKY
jgi:tetratricopeptide (TPR) repeat protein